MLIELNAENGFYWICFRVSRLIKKRQISLFGFGAGQRPLAPYHSSKWAWWGVSGPLEAPRATSDPESVTSTSIYLLHPVALCSSDSYLRPSLSFVAYRIAEISPRSNLLESYSILPALSNYKAVETMALRPSLLTRGLSTGTGPSDTGSPAEQRDDAKKNMLKAMRPLPTQHYWNVYFDG